MIRRTLAAFAFLSVLTAPTAAQDYPPLPEIGTPPPFTVPASETYQLPNGVQVTLIPYGSVPKAVVSLRVYAGSINEGDDTGLAAFTAQMLREGAGGRSNSDIAEAAAAMGGSLAVGSNAHETTATLNVLSEHADDAIRLLADVIRRAEFPASEFDRVRQDFMRGIAVAKSQPQTAATAALVNAYYGPAHPYGRMMPTDAQLRAFTVDDLRQFHADNYGARRSRIYVAGRFDPEEVKAAIQRALSDWQPGSERLSLPPEPRPGPRILLVDRPGAPQSTLRLAFPAPSAGAADDIAFRVTNALLGGSFTSRITRNIRENKGYTYSPFSGIGHNAGEAIWTFNADVTSADTANALREVFNEINGLQRAAPGDEEAGGMRTWMAGTFVLQNASPSGLVSSLATRDFHGLPADWLESYVPAVLGVSAARMQALARDRLPLAQMTLVVVGDLATVEPQLRAMPELRGLPMSRVDPFAAP